MDEIEDKELEQIKRKKMEELMEEEEGPDFPDSPITLTDSNFQDIVNHYPLVLVDFWSEGCPPCKAMEPILERLAEKYSGEIVIGKLNVKRNPQTSRNFQVMGTPTLLVFKNGEPVDKIVGMTPGEMLESKLEKYMN